MKKLRFLISLLAFFFCTNVLSAQSELLDEVNRKRIQLNRVNMSVLGAWAIGNMAISGVRRSQTEGSTRYFHEMNVFWNVVNLGLALGGFYGAWTENPNDYSLYETNSKQQQIEKILLFNLALNGTYITAGAWMRERSKSFTNDPLRRDRFDGYGKSLLLQGGFLLAFDLTQYWLHHSHAAPKLRKVMEGISMSENGIGLMIHL